MKSFVAAIATLLIAAPASAQPAPETSAVDPRINQLIVYGDDPCPSGTDAEIIVCARKPEGERFRIPENLRDDPNSPLNESWAARATEMQFVGRTGIGSCSTVGQGGMIGCYNEIVRQARAERATRDSVNWNRLIEEARQERLGRIDGQAEAEEEAANPR